jgi:hypothetical protein
MKNTRHTSEVESLIAVFRRAVRPPTPIEWLIHGLETALEVLNDTTRSEADRMKEIRWRLVAMLPAQDPKPKDHKIRHPKSTAI